MEQADPADAARSATCGRRTTSTRPRATGSWPCTTAGDLAGASELHLERGASGLARARGVAATLIDSADQQMTRRRRPSNPIAPCSRTHRHRLLGRRACSSPCCSGSSCRGRSSCPSARWQRALAGITAGDFDAAGRRAEPRRVRAARPRPQQHQRAAGRAVRGAARPGRTARGDERVAGAGERGEVALPGEREPRAADADERDPRIHRRAPRRRRRAAQRGADGVPRLGAARWPRPARADQRDPRPVEDRGRQARPSTPQPFDPRELVESVVAQHRSLAAQKGIRFAWQRRRAPRPRSSSTASGSARSSSTSFGNALKFTAAGRGRRSRPSGAGDRASASRSATPGPGIAADQHEAIFEEFRQAEGDGAGTGLGLAISRRLARAMGGDITLESELGQGSVFHLTLPLDCRTEPDRPAGSEPERGPRRRSACSSASTTTRRSRRCSRRCSPATGTGSSPRPAPSTAVSDARRLRPAAILLDLLHARSATGATSCASSRATRRRSDIPVIVVSVVDARRRARPRRRHLASRCSQDALLRDCSRSTAPAPRVDA